MRKSGADVGRVETVPIFGSELDLKSSCKIDQLAQLTWNSPTSALEFSKKL